MDKAEAERRARELIAARGGSASSQYVVPIAQASGAPDAPVAAPVNPGPTPERLTVKIFSPYQVFYQGSAVSVTANNKTGPFDILFNHSNFFSLLPPGVIKVNTGFETIDIEVNSGILRVAQNTVTLFANV
jgi:hypothetical protein